MREMESREKQIWAGNPWGKGPRKESGMGTPSGDGVVNQTRTWIRSGKRKYSGFFVACHRMEENKVTRERKGGAW